MLDKSEQLPQCCGHLTETEKGDIGADGHHVLCERGAEACPGCGCKPGEGISAHCNHPDGCGYYKTCAGAQ